MKYDYEVVGRKVAYQRHFRVEELRLRHRRFGGGWSEVLDRELIDRGDAAAVVPYDPVRDELVMIEQFRTGAMRPGESAWIYEFIAGLIGEHEQPAEVAVREAREEANLDVHDLVPIGAFYLSPGGSTEKLHLFCGRADTRAAGGVFGLASEGEDIRAHVLPREDAERMLEDGSNLPAWTALALQWLMINRRKLIAQWGLPGAS